MTEVESKLQFALIAIYPKITCDSSIILHKKVR
jgi:hypothetical protein